MPSQRVLLVGMMGAGKTSVGRALAARLGCAHLDNDELVLRATGRPTAEVLAGSGEGSLRQVEAAALEHALAAPAPVVAGVAAGAVLDEAARRRLRREAFVVYLRAPVDLLVARVGDGAGRPWLDQDVAATLEQLFEGRAPLYEQAAHLVLDVQGSTPEELAERIVQEIESSAAAPAGTPGSPQLVLGPLLRWCDEDAATVWVETSRPCEVRVLDHSARTFTVSGRHYALVVVRGLRGKGERPYGVHLDGTAVWPDPDSALPPSTIRPVRPGGPVRLLAGSCLNAAPHEAPYDGAPSEDARAVGPDVLRRAAERLVADPDSRPDLLVLLGDQVYADSDPTGRLDGPLLGFTANADLYRQAWSEPTIRWLLSCVPSAMIWDDHEVIDDWNISADWVDRVHAEPEWDDRISGALAAYWVHQHLGNLPPDEIDSDEVLARLGGLDDGWALLREQALHWDRGTAGTDGARWSHERRIGDVEVLVVDSRNGRVLQPGERWMNDRREREWLERAARNASGAHLVIASSVPVLLPPGLHGVERWNEVVADGAWGRRAARLAERVRQKLDLEHWASFGRSYDWLEDLMVELSSSPEGPRSITLLSGDVHFAYVAPARHGTGDHAPIHQVVTSPLRNRIEPHQQRQLRIGTSAVGRALGRVLSALARVPRPRLRWHLADGPLFENNHAVLRFDGTGARVTITAVAADGDHEVITRTLASPPLAKKGRWLSRRTTRPAAG